jgi:hypothetical protein
VLGLDSQELLVIIVIVMALFGGCGVAAALPSTMTPST